MMQARSSFLLWTTVLLLGTVFSYFHLFSASQEAALPAYEKAFAQVKSDRGSNDIVFIHPPWRQDIVSALRSQQDDGAYQTITTVLPSTAGIFGRVLVLADTAAPPLSWRVRQMFSQKEGQEIDGIAIQFLKGKPNTTGTNFINLLSTAQVSVTSAKGKTTTCKWQRNKQKFKCPKHPNWVYVGPHVAKTKGKEKQCIWGHPVSKGKVQIRFAKPPLQSQLIFEHGFSDSAIRSNNKSPVTTTILRDGQKLRSLTKARTPGFSRSSFIIDSPNTQTLDVIIQAENDGAAHYCFNLKTQDLEKAP